MTKKTTKADLVRAMTGNAKYTASESRRMIDEYVSAQKMVDPDQNVRAVVEELCSTFDKTESFKIVATVIREKIGQSS